MTKQIGKESFNEQVLGGKGVALVDFFAEWCGPCKMLAPSLEELSAEGYQIYSVDIDREQELAAEYGVMSIPTLIFFKDGEKMDRIVGLTAKSALKDKLDYYNN